MNIQKYANCDLHVNFLIFLLMSFYFMMKKDHFKLKLLFCHQVPFKSVFIFKFLNNSLPSCSLINLEFLLLQPNKYNLTNFYLLTQKRRCWHIIELYACILNISFNVFVPCECFYFLWNFFNCKATKVWYIINIYT